MSNKLKTEKLLELRTNSKNPAAWGNYWAQKCIVLLNHIRELEEEECYRLGKKYYKVLKLLEEERKPLGKGEVKEFKGTYLKRRADCGCSEEWEFSENGSGALSRMCEDCKNWCLRKVMKWKK